MLHSCRFNSHAANRLETSKPPSIRTLKRPRRGGAAPRSNRITASVTDKISAETRRSAKNAEHRVG